MGVVGNDVSFLAHHTEEDALGGAALVRRDDVGVSKDVLDGVAKLIEAAASGVTLIAFHHGGPLVRGHGSGARVGEEIDEDIVGAEKKEIVVGGAEKVFALGASRPANGFDAFDAEGFDDGASHVWSRLVTFLPSHCGRGDVKWEYGRK